MTTILDVRDLTAGYAEPIVRGVSFTTRPGEVLAIVGVNGAGKSTILKAIVGDARVHAGKVRLNDVDITGRRGHVLARSGLGYVPQTNDVFPGLTVAENLMMGGYLLPRGEAKQRRDEVMERFPQLAPLYKAPAHKLSGGERKQLAIARALIPNPTTLLVDEPTSNLSPNIAEEVLLDLLRRLATEGTAVVVVEQRVELVLEAADRACLIGGGRMQQVGDAAEMLNVVRSVGLLSESREAGEV